MRLPWGLEGLFGGGIVVGMERLRGGFSVSRSAVMRWDLSILKDGHSLFEHTKLAAGG